MSEEQEQKQEITSEKKYKIMLDDFKSKVSGSTTAIKNGVVKILVDREIEKRQNKIIAALERIQITQKDFNKIKPDIQNYDNDGTAKQALFSKSKNDERQKLKREFTKLDNAINAALHATSPDFSKLNELIK